MQRRQFLACAAGAVVSGDGLWAEPEKARSNGEDFIDLWQRETDAVESSVYRKYMADADTRSLVSLEKLERGFERAVSEARAAEIGATPGVWSIYNMGYIVKTKKSFFAIDLVHRRAAELAKELDFALITHNHGDHCHMDLYRSMNAARKTVVSNFLDNYGVRDWNRQGGFTRAEKVFRFHDVEVRTSLVDHNAYLLDFTTAFEIRVGTWTMYHTGDCGVASKLRTAWGKPDLWTFFPGCGIDVADAVSRIRPKHLVFGHMWELAHDKGRLTAPLIRSALRKAQSVGVEPRVALWGERIA